MKKTRAIIAALFLICTLILGSCTRPAGIAGTLTATDISENVSESEDNIAETVTETTNPQIVSIEQTKHSKPKKAPPLEAVNTKENYEKIFENFANSDIYYGAKPTGAPGMGEIVEEGVVREMEAAFAPQADLAVTGIAKDGADTSAADDYSSTNVQVAGVDEADLIKTDGKFIYYCMDDTLFVVETDDKGGMKPAASETYRDFNAIEMYLDNSFLVVIGSDGATGTRYSYAYGYGYSNATTVKIYERRENGGIDLIRTVSLDGGYLTSRKIEQSVYVITDSWRYDKIMPFYVDTAVSGDKRDVPLDSMYIMPDYTVNSIMTVAAIDLSDNTKEADIQTFVGSADVVYMSKEALYISFSRWFDKNYGTTIYKFALESDYVTYESSGSVEGQLLNQFSMDEYEGHLRVAVTDVNAINASSNAIYILDGQLKIVSQIDEIAPGERIYSVRFMGGRGYVVTFRQTDPLFAFDLSDPNNPKLLGALKIPGYSTYLHPYDENHLIGFGQDTIETKNGAVLSTGIKISMFDVTDLTNPTEMFVTYIGDRGSTSPLLNNHKAILQNTARNIFAFPATENRVTAEYRDEWSYGSFYQQGAFVYNIDMDGGDSGFKLRGVITHKSEEEILKAGMYYSNSETDVERIIYIGDYFYTVSRREIQSHDINSLMLADRLTVGKTLS